MGRKMETMQEERYQKELFIEFEKPKKPFSKINMLPGRDFTVILTLEKLVFLVIGIIMLLVVIYALGVERGRTIMRKTNGLISNRQSEKTAATHTQGAAPQTAASAGAPKTLNGQKNMTVNIQKNQNGPGSNFVVPVAQSSSTVLAITTKPKVITREEVANIPSESSTPIRDAPMPYTIVAAAFSKKEWALKEVENLKKSGLDAFVAQSDPYFLACVGAFSNKDGAKATLNRVKKIYKDAYLKLK